MRAFLSGNNYTAAKKSSKELEMLTPNHDHEIPEMTVEVAQAASPKGNAVMKIRDELGPLFEDDEFAALYPTLGQPAESPARLALVTILQFMENLTDREAADAVRKSKAKLDTRYSSKYGVGWTGYKFHVTETCDPDEPRLITQVTTTVATVPESNMTEAIQEDLISRDLSPGTHWVDAGYVNKDNLLSSQEKGIDLLGPARGDSSWQACMEGGYDQTQFIIDWENMIATCPEGQHSMFWKEGKSSWGRPNIHFLFSQPLCFQCSAREKCSRGKKNGRHLTVSPRPAFEMLKQAREREQTEAFKEEYKRCAGVEGTIAQAVNAMGARHNRYRGLARTRLQHVATASAINLRRIAAWLMGDRSGATRVSPFAMLVAPL
jgi:hypothetical protein